MLHEQFLHEVDVYLLPPGVIPLQHLHTTSRKEREVIHKYSMPFVLVRDLHQMATILEEVVWERDWLSTRETMYAEDREIGIQGDEERIESLVNLSCGRQATICNGTVFEVDHMPSRFENTTGVELVQLSGRKFMVKDGVESLSVDMLKQLR